MVRQQLPAPLIPGPGPPRIPTLPPPQLLLQLCDHVFECLDHSGLPALTFLVCPVNELPRTGTKDAEEAAQRDKPLKIHTFNRPSGASGNLGDDQVPQLPRVVVERLVVACFLVDHEFDVVAGPEIEDDFGFGLRFHGPFSTPLRVELSRGREGLGFTFSSSAAF